MSGAVIKHATNTSSYDVRRIADNAAAEIARLEAQVALFWPQEVEVYGARGLRDGMELLEVGSGPGALTTRLLQRFPSVRITCVEIDPLLLDVARAQIPAGDQARCELRRGSILDLPYGRDTFDAVLVRLVLEHVPNPRAAVTEILRVLHPGGTAIIVDNDFGMHVRTYPAVDGLVRLYDAYSRARTQEGGHPQIGRRLPSLLKGAGFSEVSFDAICAHNELIGDEAFGRSEGMTIAQRLVQDGYLSSQDLASVTLQWRAMLRSSEHSILRQIFVGTGMKARSQ